MYVCSRRVCVCSRRVCVCSRRACVCAAGVGPSVKAAANAQYPDAWKTSQFATAPGHSLVFDTHTRAENRSRVQTILLHRNICIYIHIYIYICVYITEDFQFYYPLIFIHVPRVTSSFQASSKHFPGKYNSLQSLVSKAFQLNNHV